MGEVKQKPRNKTLKPPRIRWLLVVYDLIIAICISLMLIYGPNLHDLPPFTYYIYHFGLFCILMMACRFIFKVYTQIWRYGGIQCYMRLVVSDVCALILFTAAEFLLNLTNVKDLTRISVPLMISLGSVNLIFSLTLRMLYRYIYKMSHKETKLTKFLAKLVKIFGNTDLQLEKHADAKKIKIAIVGAGSTGVGLAEELLNNDTSPYVPRMFIDVSKEKVGRNIYQLPVYSENEATMVVLNELDIQEIVIALPNLNPDEKKKLYEKYKKNGLKVKVYDYPTISNSENAKKAMREFDIEELLFRKTIDVIDDKTKAYYKDKVVLITGGGGSIGSEMCRQIAKMEPKSLIILDVYENGAYDIQQELRYQYKDNLDLHVEILSVTDYHALDMVFNQYHPNVIINAAAHKHVPLMEHNVIEAIHNNIFGTYNTVKLTEKYHCERYIMVSTDKAVNPTNVMGATKRMCEMIALSYASHNSGTIYSCTRFGNVLGSAGSVIPLFKRQIANGGPITITDKRIIRYFMTIPEASQLVLTSATMAKNGELFVLDMGKPIHILELAESMISLSGFVPYKDIDIVETGLRPGEKLYEELLIKNESLTKTDNELIFIEKDEPIDENCLEEKLSKLEKAVADMDNDLARNILHEVVPTYKTPEEVNKTAILSKEMKQANE